MRSSMRWTFGFAAANLAVTAVLYLSLQHVKRVSFSEGYHVASPEGRLLYDFLTLSITALHLPTQLFLEDLEVATTVAWLLLLAFWITDAIAQGYCVFRLRRCWQQLPAWFLHREGAYFNRSVLKHGSVFAFVYCALSFALYIDARYAAAGFGPDSLHRIATDALRILHPAMTRQPESTGDVVGGLDIVIGIVDCVLWGTFSAFLWHWLKRNCLGHYQEDHSQVTSSRSG